MQDNAAKITGNRVKTSIVLMGLTLFYELEGNIIIWYRMQEDWHTVSEKAYVYKNACVLLYDVV